MPPREHGRWQIARRVNCHLVRLFAFNRVCHLDTRALPYPVCHLDTRALPYTPAARAYGLPAPKGVAFCSGTVQKVAHAAITRLRRSNRSERLYAATVLSLTLCAISATSAGKLVRSAANRG